jgi:hypothetical protein
MHTIQKQPNQPLSARALGSCAAALCTLWLALPSAAQPSSAQQPASSNQSSRRYEVNQTFDGRSFLKDNNVWVVNRDFADLFGMPAAFIDDVQGVAAAAFRIEDTSYQRCGMGGRADNCMRVEHCLLDLYFDEAKTPLPWATDIRSYWVPHYSSLPWLRSQDPKERPHGMLAIEPAPGVLRNETFQSAVIPFADPTSKRQAIFLTNSGVQQSSPHMSGSQAIMGYTRDYYRGLSVVSLQHSCLVTSRKTVDIQLEAKVSGVFDPPIARFNRVQLPESFVTRINQLLKTNSDRNAAFYRSLFPTPTAPASPLRPTQPQAPETR